MSPGGVATAVTPVTAATPVGAINAIGTIDAVGAIDADVAHEAGPGVEHAGREPGQLQPRLEGGGGTELLVAQLRVPVQITAEGDQLGTEVGGQHTGQGHVGGGAATGEGITTAMGITGTVGGAGLLGIGLTGHQLVHPFKVRPLHCSTNHRSTKVQPLRRKNHGAAGLE